MDCVLFAKIDQVFSLQKKQNIKKNIGKMAKSTGKTMEFCQSEKVATLSLLVARYSHLNDGFWLKKF